MEQEPSSKPSIRTNEAQETLAEFLHAVSHDLNAPLREIKGFAGLLQEHCGSEIDDKAKQYLFHIMHGSAQTQAMLDALLQYARLDTRGGVMQEVDTLQMAQRSLRALVSRIEAGGADIRIEPLPRVFADAEQLVQLFHALVDNALKFADHGRAPRIDIGGSETDEGWRFFVRDNGIGLPHKDEEEIFKPLRKLHPEDRYSGIGMGLAFARKIVGRHGGRIWVESQPGEGSTFWFTLAHKAKRAREAA